MPLFKALPTGTIVGNTDTQTLTNKTIDSASNTMTGKQLVGTTTNDAATAGNIGQEISTSAAGVSLVTGTAKTVASMTLTAGDWDLSGVVAFIPAATTSVQGLISSISDTTNSRTTGLVVEGIRGFGSGQVLGATYSNTLPTHITRISLSGSQTVFLVATAEFTVSTMTCSGWMRARRIR